MPKIPWLITTTTRDLKDDAANHNMAKVMRLIQTGRHAHMVFDVEIKKKESKERIPCFFVDSL